MQVKINIGLEEYIQRGNKNTEGLLVGSHPLMGLVLAYYDLFATRLWSDNQPVPEIPMFLSTNAFMLWTSAVRMAMSGHEMAVYPLLRTALESACYALLVKRRPELAEVWSNREKGPNERKACRRAFGSAVLEIAKQLSAVEPALGEFVAELYEFSIDAGAHPNSTGVMANVQAAPPGDTQTRFDQGSLYPGNSIQVFRALMATINFGQGVSMVLAHCLPVLSTNVGEALRDLQVRQVELFSCGSGGSGPDGRSSN